MAAEKQGSALPASGLAVVIAIVFGFVVVKELPLEKYRPGQPEKNSEQLIDLQDADARLWQDPFAAVERHHQEVAKLLQSDPELKAAFHKTHVQLHEPKALRDEIDKALKEGPLTVLAVAVTGAPYAEDVERRQRYRYAAVAGLNRAAFAPENNEHVGYLITGRPDERCTDTDRLPDKIPFEWFVPTPERRAESVAKGASTRKVLLVWLSENPLSKEPVQGLQKLTACLGIDREHENLRTRLFGPATSDTLREIVLELAKRPPKQPLHLQIYSPFATAQRMALAKGLPDTAIPYCSTASAANPAEFCIARTTTTDYRLAESIVQELRKRGVNATCQGGAPDCIPDRLALVSEWDTFYGRSLPQALAAVLCPKRELSDCGTIVQASYLQGIDGTLPGEGATTASRASDASKRPDKDQTRESARTERADGRHQFDYLRRLADRLKQQNEGWAGHRGEIKAIGILGSDVYDKLLVLRALRKEFPQAQFFTTDVDARMLHPDEFPWTRNIVVASGYGLQLRKELQGDVPPFRDVYQTALFFTTLVALAPNAKTPAQADVDKRMSPRIFEIGRNHAYGLDRDGGGGDCHWENPLACDSIHPEPMKFVPPWLRTGLWLYLPAAILALVLLLPIYARHKRAAPERDLSVRLPVLEGDAECGIERRIPLDVARELLARRRTRALRYFVYVSVALVPLLHVAAVLLLGSTDEPITFYEGISVWPSEALRIYAGVLAVFLTYWAMLRMEGNQLELTQWFFPHSRDHGIPEFEFNRLPVRRSLWVNRTPQNLLRIFAGNLLETQPDNDPQAPIRAKEFWCQCAFHSSLAPTLIRTFFASVVFCAFSFIFVWIVGIPHTPYRGEASKIVDYVVVLLVSTPPLVFLTFYVVDATLVCKRFISALIERHAEWPDDTRRYFGATALDERLDAAARDIELAYDDWIDIQLIARRTAAVGSLVYYPVVVMLVLFFARSTLFDNWHWPAGLVVPLVLSMLIIAACQIVLRREAESARRIAEAQVARRLMVAKGQGSAAAKLVPQLELMLKNIEQIREGAFAPVTQQPLIKALLIFFSASGLAFLEYFGVISF